MGNPLVGQTVTTTAITRIDGIYADPASITLVVTDPAGGTNTYTWPVGPTLVRDGLGQFHKDIIVNLAGRWHFDWSATGGVTVVGSEVVQVDPVPITVMIHTQDATPTLIAGVNVVILAANDQAIVASGVTDSFGNFSVQLTPGLSYIVECSKKKTVFTPLPISVSVPATFNVTGSVLGMLDYTPPRTLTLFGYIVGPDGVPASTRVAVETVGYGQFRPFVPGAAADTGINPANVGIIPLRREIPVDPQTGFWSTQVIVDSLVRVTIQAMRFDKLFRVPNDPTITQLNIADARTDPGPGGEVGVTTDIPTRDQLKGVG